MNCKDYLLNLLWVGSEHTILGTDSNNVTRGKIPGERKHSKNHDQQDNTGQLKLRKGFVIFGKDYKLLYYFSGLCIKVLQQ